MSKISDAISSLYYSLLPVKKNTVLFSSFYGQYNDSPKYVSIRLHELYPQAKIFWVYSDKLHDELPEYVTPVEFKSSQYKKLTFTASIVVENHAGIRASSYWGNKFGIKKLLALMYSKKRKKQFNISTWHGTPLKHIAADEPNCGRVRHYTNSDYLSAGCTLTANAFKTAFLNSTPVKHYGTPRNDILLNGQADNKALKEKLGIPADRKVILFAPTFRGATDDFNLDMSGISQMREFDFDKIFEALHNKFGGDWCFVFRVHYNVLLNIDVAAIAEKYGGLIINGNKGDDMAEYLQCTDVLLTDYSSSMFDFALTGRPCFLYVPDREHYENDERGFYLDFDNLPFPSACTQSELLNSISEFNEEKFKTDTRRFLNEIGNFEDGHASERIADDIIKFLNTGVKN